MGQIDNVAHIHLLIYPATTTLPPTYKKNKDANPSMSDQQSKDPLHGITLEQIVNSLVEYYGWEELGEQITINCFISNPSVKSSLKFLRRTPWARKQVEDLYLAVQRIGE